MTADRRGATAPDARPVVLVAGVVTVLGMADVVPVWAGTLHHVALPPLDLFTDVRVLLAEAPSYPSFAASLAAAVALRSLLLAAMLRALDRAGIARAARLYVTSLPLALVAGGLAFAGVTAVYSMFLWAGVAIAVCAVLVVGPRPWPGDAATGRLTARLVGYVAALLVVSLLSALGSAPLQLLLVWASGALTVAAARWLSSTGPAPGRHRISTASVALAVVALGAGALPAVGSSPPRRSPEGTLFVVPGIGGASGTSTMFRFDPASLGFDCDHTVYFSYAGPGGGAPRRDARCPIRSGAPYGPEDTLRPIDELTRAFRVQYSGLEQPVVVVAHSQGGWVAAAALGPDSDLDAPDAVVLLGAFPGHRGGYRLDGTGAGVVGTDLLEALTAALRATSGTTFDPRAPLARELLGRRGAVADLMHGAFAPGVRVVVITSAFDLPIMAGDPHLPGAVELCPVYVHHGTLPRAAQVGAQIREALEVPGGGCGWWRRWPTLAFSAFAVPPP